MERVFGIPFLFQLFCSVVIFCVTGYRIILVGMILESASVCLIVNINFKNSFKMEDDFVTLAYYLAFFGLFLSEIFLMCYFGTLLTAKNDALSEALYSSNWPDLPQSFKKMMMIFLEYLRRPKVMTSGKIFTITLSSFLTVKTFSMIDQVNVIFKCLIFFPQVINRSYSMFAVLRSLIK